MKFFTAVCLVFLLSFSAVANTPPVYQETTVNKKGVTFIRIVNTTPMYLSCWINDEYNFATFPLQGQRVSYWYPVYGYYEWYCE